MGKKLSSNRPGRFSRGTFLKGVPLGLIGALAMGFLGRKVVSSAFRKNPNSFSRDSIFYPRDESRNV